MKQSKHSELTHGDISEIKPFSSPKSREAPTDVPNQSLLSGVHGLSEPKPAPVNPCTPQNKVSNHVYSQRKRRADDIQGTADKPPTKLSYTK